MNSYDHKLYTGLCKAADCIKCAYREKNDKKQTAKWIEHPHECGENWEYSMYECDVCGAWKDDDSMYCPDCGAKMENGG